MDQIFPITAIVIATVLWIFLFFPLWDWWFDYSLNWWITAIKERRERLNKSMSE